MTKSIVPADAYNEMARIRRKPVKLPLESANDVAVDRFQRRTPARRQALPQLPHDLGSARDISGVVEMESPRRITCRMEFEADGSFTLDTMIIEAS